MNPHLPLALRGLAVLLFFTLPALAHTATLNVPSAACPTIQSGIDTAHDGDIVLVADGTYTGDGNRDIDFHGKSLTVKSLHGPTKSMIDCGGYKSKDGSGNHRGFFLHSGEKMAAISGFTITNGYQVFVLSIADSGNGGGVFNGSTGGTINLTDCIITGNTAECNGWGGDGGGIYNDNAGGVFNGRNNPLGTVNIANCTISKNDAVDGNGGGVYNDNNLGGGTIALTNCAITENSARCGEDGGGNGGGLYNVNSACGGEIGLANCIVSGNFAQCQGNNIGNYNIQSAIFFTDCIISGDSQYSGFLVDLNLGAIMFRSCGFF